MLSQHSVKIVKIPCHLKDVALSIKCALFLFSWENGSIAFKYETVLPDSNNKLQANDR